MTDLIPLDAAIAAANDAVLKYLTEDFETPPEAYIREALRAIPAIDHAAIREAALREAADVNWSHGTDVFDTAPEFLTPWQRGLVAGQKAVRAAIIALIGEKK